MNISLIIFHSKHRGAGWISPQRCILWNCGPQKLAVPASISTEVWSLPAIPKVVRGGATQYHSKAQPHVGPGVWPHSRTGSARPWPITAPQAVVLGAGSEEQVIWWLLTISDSSCGIKCCHWFKSEEGRKQSGDITWPCWVGYGTSGMLLQQRTERKNFPFLSPVSKISPSNLPFDRADNINTFFVTPGGFSSCNLSLK